MFKTPLYHLHVKLGATIGDFAGWEMPIVYESIVKEHLATRNNAALFDVSHMARIWIKGENSPRIFEFYNC